MGYEAFIVLHTLDPEIKLYKGVIRFDVCLYIEEL
jgi:hypothetical protein